MAQWCRRCGGPLRDGACGNCTYAAKHPPQPPGNVKVGRVIIDPRGVRDWIATIADLAPDQNPVDALLDALLPNVDDELDVEAKMFSSWRSTRIITKDRTLELPGDVSIFLIPLLDLHCSKQNPPHSAFADQHLRRLRDGGPPMPAIFDHLTIARTKTGFHVKRRGAT